MTTNRRGIVVGQVYDCIMLDKPGGKRTGETRPVKVLRLAYCWKPKDAIREVEVLTVDDLDLRRSWVEPKYLIAQGAESAA